jgi:tetratricopeptide (TPR) repeat protein
MRIPLNPIWAASTQTADEPQPYVMRAWALYKAGRSQPAFEDANRALKLDPQHVQALVTRGHAEEVLGRKREAIGDYKSALALAPGLQDARDALARLGAQ